MQEASSNSKGAQLRKQIPIIGHFNIELSSHVLECPNDAYTTLSQNLIGCSTLREENFGNTDSIFSIMEFWDRQVPCSHSSALFKQHSSNLVFAVNAVGMCMSQISPITAYLRLFEQMEALKR